MTTKKLPDEEIIAFPDWSRMRELFLKLQEITIRAFKEYVDAMFAFNNSDLDPQLKRIMNEKDTAYQMAFSQFQSYFPNHSI